MHALQNPRIILRLLIPKKYLQVTTDDSSSPFLPPPPKKKVSFFFLFFFLIYTHRFAPGLIHSMAIFTIFVMCTSGPYLEGGRITKKYQITTKPIYKYFANVYKKRGVFTTTKKNINKKRSTDFRSEKKIVIWYVRLEAGCRLVNPIDRHFYHFCHVRLGPISGRVEFYKFLRITKKIKPHVLELGRNYLFCVPS